MIGIKNTFYKFLNNKNKDIVIIADNHGNV